jgi:hypothetical protein
MKKLIILFIAFAAFSCKTPCLLGQLPNQIVYANSNCTAILPDYRSLVTITGGCTGFTVSQIPGAGTMVDVSSNPLDVMIRATGTNGRYSQISFTVTMADTITPKIIVAETSLNELLEKSNGLYDIADNMMGKIDEIVNNTFPFDSFPGMERIDSYKNQILVIASMDSAGFRKRMSTYVDSLTIMDVTVIADTIFAK